MSIEFWLWIAFGINLALYNYLGRSMFRDSWEMSRIIKVPAIRLFMLSLPLAGFIAITAASFFWTSKGWIILVGSVGAFFLFARSPGR